MWVPPVNTRIVELAGTRLGGPFGMNPTLIFGGLFFQGDRLVTDPVTGRFAKSAAAGLIHKFLALAEKTRIQPGIVVQGQTVPALTRYLDWVADLDYYTGPIMVDAPNSQVRNPVVAHANDIGLIDRLVYDSIHSMSSPEDFQTLQDYRVQHCVLMASNPENMWPTGRLDVLQGEDGLVAKVLGTGVQNLLIDTASIGAAEMITANLAVPLVKQHFPWPVGQGTSNAVEYLRKIQAPHLSPPSLLEHSFKGPLGIAPLKGALTGDRGASELYKTLDVTYAVAARLAGIDFLLTALESAIYLIPPLAAVDAMLGYYYTRLQKGEIPNKQDHPLYRFMI